MSYRARTDLFIQYRRSYRSGHKQQTRGDGYMTVNIHEEPPDDQWVEWISSLGRLRRQIHDIEEKGTKCLVV